MSLHARKPDDRTEVAGYRLLASVAASSHGVLSVGRDAEGGLALVRRLADEALCGGVSEVFDAVAVDHPAVIPLVSLVTAERALVSAFELGMPLSLVLRLLMAQRRAPPPSYAAAWLIDALDGLDALHAAEYAPGGLSPDNVLIVEGGKVRLLEAQVANAFDASKAVAGKADRVGYRAPEQLGTAAVPRSDLFALGTMLWELLHHRRAFPGLDAAQVERQIAAGPPPVDAEIPQPLREVVERALLPTPGERFADAATMADALRQACEPPTRAELATCFEELVGAHPSFVRLRRKVGTGEDGEHTSVQPRSSKPDVAEPNTGSTSPKTSGKTTSGADGDEPARGRRLPPVPSGRAPRRPLPPAPRRTGATDAPAAPAPPARPRPPLRGSNATETGRAEKAGEAGREKARPSEVVAKVRRASQLPKIPAAPRPASTPAPEEPHAEVAADTAEQVLEAAPEVVEDRSEAPTRRPAPDEQAPPPPALDAPRPPRDSIAPADSNPPPSLNGPMRQVGRCELFAEIAHGGMATVHLGRWLGAGGFAKTVAVKALHPQYARDPEFVRMFLDEARVVARVRHPNVMPTIDLVEDAGELFIVMDYVQGATLAHLLRQMKRRRERMPIGVSLRIITGVLHGLHAAHEATDERGNPMAVIHRDVSPENILVGVDGYARLIDFGIASALGRATTTQENQVKGKPSYLSPEQVLGEPLDRRTDVYSAAVVLWESLTGRRLFKGDNLGALTFKIVKAEVSPPSSRRSDIPTPIDEVVMRGLARDLEARWPTAEEMAEELERIGGQASLREVGAWVRTVAADRLERSERILKAVEATPLTASDEGELDGPLKVTAAAAPQIRAPLETIAEVETADDSGASDAIDVSGDLGPASGVAPRRIPWLYVSGAAAAVAIIAVALASSGDAPVESVQAPATAQPSAGTTEAKAPAPVSSVTPAMGEGGAAVEPEPKPTAEPKVEPKPEPKPAPKVVAPAPQLRPSPWPPRPSPKPNPRLPDDI